MKFRKPEDAELQKKAAALLHRAFPNSKREEELVEDLRDNDQEFHEWVAIHRNSVIAYIGFSNAYRDGEKCGLHLAPMAVHPDFQGQGVGTDLIRFALRQKEIKDQTIFVLGKPGYFQRFGFEWTELPICPFTTANKHFSAKNNVAGDYTVDYEPEFY